MEYSAVLESNDKTELRPASVLVLVLVERFWSCFHHWYLFIFYLFSSSTSNDI